MSSRKVTLHIGAMKTGTTYVQRMLGTNAKVLAEQGITYPKPWSDQVEAVRDALKLQGGSHRGSIEGRWDLMVNRLNTSDGDRAILSMEFLSFADAHQAAALVDSLRPMEVNVILGGRDLARVLPAQWQTAIRNGRSGTYREYIDGVTSHHKNRYKTHFWRRQDLGRIAADWAGCVGSENTWLVTVPPSGSDPAELWRRMAEAMGLRGIDLVNPKRTNESLGPTASELLRRINVQARTDGMGNWVYQHGVNRAFSHGVLPEIPDLQPHLTVPESAHAWVREHSERVIGEIQSSGVQVVGSLEDLMPDLNNSSPFVWPEDIKDEDILEFAVAALSGFAKEAAAAKRKGKGFNVGDLSHSETDDGAAGGNE